MPMDSAIRGPHALLGGQGLRDQFPPCAAGGDPVHGNGAGEELARESRLLNLLTGRSHHDDMWSETSCPASALRGLYPPFWLRLTGQIRRSAATIYHAAGPIRCSAGPI